MTTTLPNGTRVRITWPQSTHYGRWGVIESRVADKYRIEVDDGGGTFLRPGEFEVIQRADAVGCSACEVIGPLATAPGTSGRSWRCGTCGTVWTSDGPRR